MKFGLFYLPTYLPASRSANQHFDNIVEQVTYADEIGIGYCWMVEHHFVRHRGGFAPAVSRCSPTSPDEQSASASAWAPRDGGC